MIMKEQTINNEHYINVLETFIKKYDSLWPHTSQFEDIKYTIYLRLLKKETK